MVDGFDSDALIAALAEAANIDERFAALSDGLGKIGIDIIDYGFFDLRVAKLVDADIRLHTSMRDDWWDYYYDIGEQ